MKTGNKIKAIETKYKGFRLRSRLEARWCVWFDAVGIKWEYEPEGYVLEDGTCYLPDFWLPDLQAFVECKPSSLKDDERFSVRKNLASLSYSTKHPVILLSGAPGYRILCDEYFQDFKLEVFLGYMYDPIPEPDFLYKKYRFGFDFFEGMQFFITEGGEVELTEDLANRAAPLCLTSTEGRKELLHIYGEYLSRCGKSYIPIDSAGECSFVLDKNTVEIVAQTHGSIMSDNIIPAYEAARGARFEHGETPS